MNAPEQCSIPSCTNKPLSKDPLVCSEHVSEVVEQLVKETIREHKLIRVGERVCVAASGGKDSITVLYTLKKLGYNIEALAIDEGIHDYREHTLTHLEAFCEKHNIPLRVVSFAQEVGGTLDSMVKNNHPCSVCGVYRRMLLNKHSSEYDVIATGHNLDDEAQVVLMNLITANKNLTRTHARTQTKKGFTSRIKPLLFIPEKLIRAYTIINNIDVSYDECPYVQQSLRARVRDELNTYESSHPGMKRLLVQAAVRASKTNSATTSEEREAVICVVCGQRAAREVCRACSISQERRITKSTSESHQMTTPATYPQPR